MEIKLLPQAKKDLEYWKKLGNTAIMKRISALLKDIAEHPFTGIGKPEALRFELQGLWSRRINDRHRIIYSVSDGCITVFILSMRYHYSEK